MLEKIRDERQLKALTGLSSEKFSVLAEAFANVYQAEQQQAYERGLKQRRPGGGQKGKLPSAEAKLVFVLYYFKNYPTFDVLGTHFDMARSKACENVHRLTPLLHKTLASLNVLPERTFASAEAFRASLAKVELEQLLVDVTERFCQRPGDNEKQREHYSGKKSVTP
jgi:hypothetical protein